MGNKPQITKEPNMTKPIIKISRTQEVQYIGKSAEVTQYFLGSYSLGERIIIMKWLNNGDLQMRHIQGDGRVVYPKPTLKVFSDVTIPNGGEADIFNFIDSVVNA